MTAISAWKMCIRDRYTAELNNEAVIGSAGNPNDAYLEYSNNPNDEGTGVTPNDTVIVFTYKIVVNKITENPDYKPEEEGSEAVSYTHLGQCPAADAAPYPGEIP